MKMRTYKKRRARLSKAFWLNFRRSASQGNHLSDKQNKAWEILAQKTLF